MSVSRFSSLPLVVCRSISASRAVSAGHNKWSKIKQKKGMMDAQKSSVYGKASRDIIVAVRHGGSADPAKNLALAAILKRAKEQGVPKENLAHALAKAQQGKDKGGSQHLVYEALAYDTVGIIIECLTDNPNRTIHSIREILTSHGVRFAPVGFMFKRQGCVRVALEESEDYKSQLEALVENAFNAGATDFEDMGKFSDSQNREVKLVCSSQQLAQLTSAVATWDISGELISGELIYTAATKASVDDHIHDKVKALIQELEDNEDTLRVWTNIN